MTYLRTLTIIVMMIVTAALVVMVSKSELIKPNKPFDSFPLKFGVWEGERGRLDNEIFEFVGVEDYILANFHAAEKASINLYVGFYQSQKEGDIIHSPKNCMPGSGWNITDTSIEKINLDQEETFKVIKLLLQKGSEKQVVLYWFQSRGRIISSEYMQKIWLVVDSITKNRTDGSFVRLIAPVVTDESQSVVELKEFAKKIYPHLKEYIPS